MPFTEEIKYQVKRLSHQSCCVCKSIGIEIHHIIPQSEQGEDTLDNAAPLCPSCHEIYGQNPTKRKFIKEARNIWYEICERRYAINDKALDKILTKLEGIENYLFKRVSLSENEPLTFGQLFDYFLKFKYPTDPVIIKNFEVTFLFLFGTIGDTKDNYDDEFNERRDFFYETFGRMLCEKISLYLIHRLRIDWNTGVNELTLSELMNAAFIFIVCIIDNNNLEYGARIKARLDESNDLVFSLN
ncbi:MAG: HNH endonuclease signature motif containing protein [Bacteroidota bacterium]